MNTNKQSENKNYDYIVPASKFGREFNSWFRRIISEQAVVAVTINRKIVAYVSPHNSHSIKANLLNNT